MRTTWFLTLFVDILLLRYYAELLWTCPALPLAILYWWAVLGLLNKMYIGKYRERERVYPQMLYTFIYLWEWFNDLHCLEDLKIKDETRLELLARMKQSHYFRLIYVPASKCKTQPPCTSERM